jgi:LacI family transcriptional regulator
MAAATVAVAHRRGLDVPSDLTVCGFDDTTLSTTICDQILVERHAHRLQRGAKPLIPPGAGRQIGIAADPPTAIIASNDDMAAATVAVAHRRGLDVPSDLTVCGSPGATRSSSNGTPTASSAARNPSYRRALADRLGLLDLAEPPTAIIASNDDMAAATVAVAHRRGLDVPPPARRETPHTAGRWPTDWDCRR